MIVAGGIDELFKWARSPPTAAPMARVRIGVAVRKGAPKPDIATVDAFAIAVAAKSTPMDLAAGGASGIYLARMLERIGLLAEVNAKVAWRGRHRGHGERDRARGEAEIGLQQISEISADAGADSAGPLPTRCTRMIYTAGRAGFGEGSGRRQALVRFSPRRRPRRSTRRSGLDPLILARRVMTRRLRLPIALAATLLACATVATGAACCGAVSRRQDRLDPCRHRSVGGTNDLLMRPVAKHIGKYLLTPQPSRATCRAPAASVWRCTLQCGAARRHRARRDPASSPPPRPAPGRSCRCSGCMS